MIHHHIQPLFDPEGKRAADAAWAAVREYQQQTKVAQSALKTARSARDAAVLGVIVNAAVVWSAFALQRGAEVRVTMQALRVCRAAIMYLKGAISQSRNHINMADDRPCIAELEFQESLVGDQLARQIASGRASECLRRTQSLLGRARHDLRVTLDGIDPAPGRTRLALEQYSPECDVVMRQVMKTIGVTQLYQFGVPLIGYIW